MNKAISTIDLDRLEFPKALAPLVGLDSKQIAFLKAKGCPFYGRKTTLRWVRKFITDAAKHPERICKN